VIGDAGSHGRPCASTDSRCRACCGHAAPTTPDGEPPSHASADPYSCTAGGGAYASRTSQTPPRGPSRPPARRKEGPFRKDGPEATEGIADMLVGTYGLCKSRFHRLESIPALPRLHDLRLQALARVGFGRRREPAFLPPCS